MGRTYQLAIIASLAVAGLLAALALTDLGTTFSPGHPVHVAIQTCGAIVLCFAAFLVFERFHTDARSHAARLVPAPQRLADVVLAPALGLLALTTLLFSAIPAILAKNPGAFAIWAQTLGQLAGMGAGAAAAWIPTRCTVRRRVTAAQTAGAVAVGLLVVALAALAASRLLETPAYRPSTLQTSWVPTEIILFVLIAVAFVGFARRAERDGDLLMRGLAVAAPLGGGAVSPTPSARLWARAGLSPTSSFCSAPTPPSWAVRGQSRLRTRSGSSNSPAPRSAADLPRTSTTGSRRTSCTSSCKRARSPSVTPTPKPSAGSSPPRSARWTSREGLSERSPTRLTSRLAGVLGNCVREVAHRAGAEVSLRVDGELEPSAGLREAVLRIAREATWNAVRDGPASDVLVMLQAGDPLRVTVSDDGTASMSRMRCAMVAASGWRACESARGPLAARCRSGRAPGEGTEISAILPREGTEISATLPRERSQVSLAD